MKKKFLYLACLFFVPLFAAVAEWTWLLKKNFSVHEALKNEEKDQLFFTKENISRFTQLLFSWNALRPEQGYFRFYAQVRDAYTKKWHEWHQMIDWGNQIQKSYYNLGDQGTKYHHVRLELPPLRYADSLRIKIVPQEGAQLSHIKSIAVNVANLRDFKPETLQAHIAKLPSVHMKNIPLQSQMVLDHPKAKVMCSPTSCWMLATYLTQNYCNPLDFAESAFDNGLNAYGSWPFNTAHAFERCGGGIYFRVARLNSFVDLHARLQKNVPVVVSVRGKIDGAPQEYNKGHLLLVVGWDQKNQKVLCHDPAHETSEKVYTEYDFNSFARAWGKSHHLAYLAEPHFI